MCQAKRQAGSVACNKATVSSIFVAHLSVAPLFKQAPLYILLSVPHTPFLLLFDHTLKRNVQAISNPRSTPPSHNKTGWRGLLQGQPHWLHGSSYGIWRIHYRLQESQALQLSRSDRLSGMLGVLLGGTSSTASDPESDFVAGLLYLYFLPAANRLAS